MVTQYARGRGIKLAASGHRHPQKERHCRDRAARTDNELTRAGGGLLSADPVGLMYGTDRRDS